MSLLSPILFYISKFLACVTVSSSQTQLSLHHIPLHTLETVTTKKQLDYPNLSF